MSEPSQEAKQAAKEWRYIYSDFRVTEEVRWGFAYGYDTATAKARGELEQTRRERDAVNEDYHHLQIDWDKLWDEAAKARIEQRDVEKPAAKRHGRKRLPGNLGKKKGA